MDRKKKNILLGVLIVGVISMTVAFAALSTTLNINGTASVPATSWNVHFENFSDDTPENHQDGKVNKGTITGVQTAATSITGFTATLYQPNDEVVYTFDIKNDGTITAELEDFTKSAITCENNGDCSMITYTITCEDASHNDALVEGSTLAPNAKVSCVMNLKYNDQTNTGNTVYTQGAVSGSVQATWIYSQVSGSNSGSEQGGNSEPQTPTYTYRTTGSSDFENNLDLSWQKYLRNDGEKIEVCGVFPSGTVCLVNEQNGRYSEFDSNSYNINNLTGYTAEKIEEMKSKGATSCVIYSNGAGCFGNGNMRCIIFHNGAVNCQDDGQHTCTINNEGNYQCN